MPGRTSDRGRIGGGASGGIRARGLTGSVEIRPVARAPGAAGRRRDGVTEAGGGTGAAQTERVHIAVDIATESQAVVKVKTPRTSVPQ
jgi:hypothetical protein